VGGRYRVLALLQSGCSGGSFVAVDERATSARRLVVLETLREPRPAQEAIDAFVASARLRERMNHPNVVQAFELLQHEGWPIVVTEYLEGESLATLLALGFGMPEFSLEVRLAILARALRGLRYVHQFGDAAGWPLRLVHGSVSPHDIVVTYDGAVKLAGFGTGGAGRRRTSVAIAPSELEYLAPEQLQGNAEQPADVFAAGVLLWELVALQRFWNHLPEYEVRRRLLTFDIPNITRLEPSVTGELGRICQKALMADRGQRYGSATELSLEFERYLAERSAIVAPATIASVMASACGPLRREARQALDRAFDALHGLTRVSEVPIEAGVWHVPSKERSLSRTTAAWAAGALGALLIALAVQRVAKQRPVSDDAVPTGVEPVAVQPVPSEPAALEPLSVDALPTLPADDARPDGEVSQVADGAALGPERPTTAIQTLIPDPELSRRGPPGVGTRGVVRHSLGAERQRAAEIERARKVRRPGDAAPGEPSDDSAVAPRDGTPLTIRLER